MKCDHIFHQEGSGVNLKWVCPKCGFWTYNKQMGEEAKNE